MKYINIIPLIIIILIDILGINQLWNERYERRVLHHIQGNNYNSHKVPLLYKVKNMLSSKQISNVLSINLPKGNELNTKSHFFSNLVGGQYSTKSSLYFNAFNLSTQKQLEAIALSIKPRLEKLCGKKLQLGKSDFRCIILRYEGKYSNFGWHYDTEPHNCYRTICLIKAKGTISPFIYKNKQNQEIPIHLSIGDGIFFKGTQTHHTVKSSNDNNTVRWILGFQYTAGSYPKLARSLCSELRGATIKRLILIFLPKIILLLLVVHISKQLFPKLLININYYLLLSIIIIILSYFLPKYTKTIGTGIISTNYSIFTFLLFLTIHYFDPFISIGHLAYLLGTEMLLPSRMVSNTLKNGGS